MEDWCGSDDDQIGVWSGWFGYLSRIVIVYMCECESDFEKVREIMRKRGGASYLMRIDAYVTCYKPRRQ